MRSCEIVGIGEGMCRCLKDVATCKVVRVEFKSYVEEVRYGPYAF